ncbi:MAG TPA: non-homologous end-joining DNA ligase [Actinomycetes bacterium]|jgi:bifunctional non-homologous end joining protein LigD|nr:non-homologous end-joining DNA ligase [Actinomycetes bacterium]
MTTTTVEISNPDKVLFPDDGITKGDLARYYERVAERMLPHVHGRPVHMQRFPDGINGEEIQQKQVPEHFPDFVHRVQVERKGGGSLTHAVIDNRETLVYLAGQACVTPHTWLARQDRLDNPDQLVFDLDPAGDGMDPLRAAARALRALLDDLGLPAYLKTTGSRGLHVVVPLDRGAGFDQARSFAREVAGLLAARDPGRLTTEQRRDKRRGRLYLDTARNAYAQTAVAPYAVRALPGAPIAWPVGWRELGRVQPRSFTLANAQRRLARRSDPWAGMRDDARSLREPSRRLRRLRA